MKLLDMTGARVGRLKVIERAANGARGKTRWLCVCDCGKSTVVRSDHLRNITMSCGCLSIEKTISRSTTHGMARRGIKIPEYKTWTGMRLRCSPSASEADRKDYFERGIVVCERWQEFRNFLDDMGERPDGLTIDRIDNDGNYSCGKCKQCLSNGWPANCRWADAITQANNKSKNRSISLDGDTRNLSQWAASVGILPSSMSERLDKWNKKEALTTGKVFKYAKR